MKYRKKPVVIEAVQFTGTNTRQILDFIGSSNRPAVIGDGWIEIFILEGTMRADPGDYIICGVKGEFYPCKPDIFKATYDKAPADYKDRMRVEYYDLNERWNKLGAFFQTAAYGNLNDKQKALLEAQHKAMAEYRKVLEERIKLEGIVL